MGEEGRERGETLIGCLLHVPREGDQTRSLGMLRPDQEPDLQPLGVPDRAPTG